MEKISAAVAWRLADRLRGGGDPKQQQSGTATFSRMDNDGTAWIRIPGNDFDTPVEGGMYADANEGDTVTYTISGGQVSISGNATSPAVGGTYVAEKVRPVERKADVAYHEAERAHDAADAAEAEAERAHSAADDAQSSANAAQVSATNANEYASRALGNLSTVQSVAETLAWVTEHGTMTLTSDVTPDPTHVYFVVDANGDYTVGSTRYSVVTEPDADDMATYYELSIDESLNNYVGTHLAVTGDGLWVIPEANGYKILIATGSGSTYTTAGTYIVDGTGGSVAFFRANGARIGRSGESHLDFDYHSIQLIDKEGNTYFHVSDLRDSDGTAEYTETFKGDGWSNTFGLTYTAVDTTYSVTVSDSSGGAITSKTTGSFMFSTAPTDGATITATYYTESDAFKALTFGSRASGTIGADSVGLGRSVIADGNASYAEGSTSRAGGDNSHAEGFSTTALGEASHAEGSNSSTSAKAYGAHAEGWQSFVMDTAGHAEGRHTRAFVHAAHAEGWDTETEGIASHVEGYQSSATSAASYSHAEGEHCTTSALAAHAEGYNTTASGPHAHSEGYETAASGTNSHAEGQWSTASGAQAHAQNEGTLAAYDNQTAIGRYNSNDSDNALEVGNGTGSNARSNAFTVDWSGNVTSDGGLLKLDNAQGETRTYLQAVEESALNRTRLGTHRSVNGTDVYNNLNLTIDSSGNRSVSLNQAAWLDALGLSVSDTAMTVNTTNTTSIGTNKVRRSGKVVTVHIIDLKIKESLANSTTSPTLATVPSGYRPSWNVYGAAVRVSNIGSSYWRIDTNGALTLRNQSGSSFAADTNFTGTITYVIA